MELEQGQLWQYIAGTAGAFLALILAYTSGLKIMRIARVQDLQASYGKRMPEQLQWHMVLGLATGALFLVVELSIMSWGAGGWTSPAALGATALVGISGLARTFMGGSGRLHMISALVALPVYLARLAAFVLVLAR